MGRAYKVVESKAITASGLDEAKLLYRTRAQEYRSAKFAEQIAHFELEMARAALVRTQPDAQGPSGPQHFEIHSPITGRVLRVLQESATVVPAGTRLLELGDPRDLEVEIDVLSEEAVKITPGAKVLLEHWGGDEPFEATVRLIEPQAFTKVSALGVEEQRVFVIADFDQSENASRLGDGYRVEARVVIWQNDNVLKVPTNSLFRHEGDWAVFVVEDDRAVLRPIGIGQYGEFEAEVRRGLQAGDQVIVHPSDKITRGVAITAR